MSKKFRVGQKVIVGDEFQGIVVGESHSRKGKMNLVEVDGEEHAIADKNLKPASKISLATLLADADEEEVAEAETEETDDEQEEG